MVAEGAMQRRWEKFIGMTSRASQDSRFNALIAISITSLLQQLISVGIVLLGVYLVYDGSITVGALIACTLIAGRALAPLAQVTHILIKLQQTRMALHGLDHLMELPSERSDTKKYISYPKLKGDIEFENVTFAYPMSEYPVLHNVSFKIAAGEKVALIGSSGSGKTTIQRLVLGLYKPQQGNIRLDGIDIQQIDPIDIRRNVGSFLQDFILFYGSLRDNIALKHPWVDDESILRAAKLACVDDFARLHHEGYHMLIDERGASLSGGQRQCVMLARAYLGNPPILLLDEPTGSMDYNTEKNVITNLSEFVKNKTLLMTAHRLSLLSLVDKLIVIDKGTVVAHGPKEKILERLKANTTSETGG
jgi:ATP-binding cassette subfamily C protein LapB